MRKHARTSRTCTQLHTASPDPTFSVPWFKPPKPKRSKSAYITWSALAQNKAFSTGMDLFYASSAKICKMRYRMRSMQDKQDAFDAFSAAVDMCDQAYPSFHKNFYSRMGNGVGKRLQDWRRQFIVAMKLTRTGVQCASAVRERHRTVHAHLMWTT